MSKRGEWEARVRAWKASGLTCRAYAEQAGVNASTLAWWRSRLASSAGTGGKRRKATRRRKAVRRSSFVELTPEVVVASERTRDGIEIELREVQVRLPENVDGAQLARVLEGLRSRG